MASDRGRKLDDGPCLCPQHPPADRCDLAWDDRVRLLGACPNAEVATHLMHHQVLAVPSLYEAFGIAYLEAMGFGLPVIAFQRRWGT